MNIKARAVKQIKTIFDELYGSHMVDAIRKINVDDDYNDEEYSEIIWSAYLNLRFTFESDRSVGITLEGMEVLDHVIAALHDLAVKKSMIPSIRTNQAVPYLMGYELSKTMLNSDCDAYKSECFRLLGRCAELWSSNNFRSHLRDFENEVSITSFKEATWILSEYHRLDTPFIAGMMAGLSGESLATIEVNRILDSISNFEEEVE